MTSFDWLQAPALILATITHPAVWPWVAYDDQDPETCALPAHVAYAGAWDGDRFLGVFGVETLSGQTLKAHIYLLPAARGRGVEVCASFIAWLRAQSEDLETIVGETPAGNRLALACLRKLGFVEAGRLKDAVTQQGQKQDLVISQLFVRR